MHDPIPTCEPRSVTAGDTWQWRRRVAGHRADDGWGLVYYLQGPSNGEFAGVAEADGNGWLVTVAPEDTQGLDPAGYQLHGFVQKLVASVVTERHRIYQDGLAVLANPAVQEAPRRSHAQEMYELLTAAIEGRLSADREQVIIDGTQITRIPHGDLERKRGIYAELVRQELDPHRSPIRSVVTRDAV